MKHHLHIPFPEKLTDEEWSENYHQLVWLLDFEASRYNAKEKVNV